jgi:WD40 repeat protein
MNDTPNSQSLKRGNREMLEKRLEALLREPSPAPDPVALARESGMFRDEPEEAEWDGITHDEPGLSEEAFAPSTAANAPNQIEQDADLMWQWAAEGSEPLHARVFSRLNQEFATLPTNTASFLTTLMGPSRREWFRACHAFVHGLDSELCSEELAGALRVLPSPQARFARLYCEAARLLKKSRLSLEMAEPDLVALADDARQSRSLLLDIATELLTPPEVLTELYRNPGPYRPLCGDLRAAEAEENVAVCLMARHRNPQRDHSVLARLVVELVSVQIDQPARSLDLYQAPALALLEKTEDFETAVANAAKSAFHLVPEGTAIAVRFRLMSTANEPLPRRISGPSLGLALAFLLHRLLARPGDIIRDVDLTGVGMAGPVDPTGKTLLCGRGILDKSSDPRISVFVTPRLDFEPGSLGRGRVWLQADGVKHAADLLAIERTKHRPGLESIPPEVPEDFVGRERLLGVVMDFLQEKSSGHFVILGRAGVGKTTFMKKLCRQLGADGWNPTYHFALSEGGIDCRGAHVAERIYHQLRRKHVTPEPAEWANWEMKQKIAELLNYLSGRNAGATRRQDQIEIILIDGANQIELPEGHFLVPDILPAKLPQGVICITTSFPEVPWIADVEAVAPIGNCMDGKESVTDEKKDIADYLRLQSIYELDDALIERIVTQDEAPVFFTVVDLLNELRKEKESADPKHFGNELLRNPTLWLSPSKKRVEKKIAALWTGWDAPADRREVVLNVLGLLAFAREPLSMEALRELELWSDAAPRILEKSASFFLPRDKSRFRDKEPFRFAHPCYQAVIKEEIRRAGIASCDRKLGDACLSWKQLERVARGYALRHGAAHLRRAGDRWPQLCALLTDFEFLTRRIDSSEFPADSGEQSPAVLHEQRRAAVARVLRDIGRTLDGLKQVFPDGHDGVTELSALHQALDRSAHILCLSPELLVQQLYNSADCAAVPALRSKLEDAIGRTRDTVLKITDRPGLPPAHVPKRVYWGHRAPVRALAVWDGGEQGNKIASGSEDQTVIIWDQPTGKVLRILRGHEAPVRSVSWHPGGEIIASVADRVYLWDAATGALRGTMRSSEGAVCADFSPDGKTLAVAGPEGSVRLIDSIEQGTGVVLLAHGPRIRSLAFSRTGRWLAVGTGNRDEPCGTVELFDVSSCSHVRTVARLGHWAEAVAFSPDEKTLAVGGAAKRGEVQVFAIDPGLPSRRFEVHSRGVKALAFLTNDEIVTASHDYTVTVHDLRNGDLVLGGMYHHEVVTAVATCAEGGIIISAGADNEVVAWDIRAASASSEQRATEASRRVHTDTINAARLAPDGQSFATAARDGTARIHYLSDQQPSLPYWTNAEVVHIAAISPDGKMIAVGSGGTVKIFSTETSRLLRELRGHEKWVRDLVWSNNSQQLLTASEDHTAILFDVATGVANHTLVGHTAGLRAVQFSPDQKLAATAGDDARIHIWDLATGKLIHALVGHQARIKALAWMSDGRLASGGSDKSILIWNPISGKLDLSIEAPGDEIWTLCASPDGKRLAAGCKDGGVRLFDVATRKQIAWLPCSDAILAVWFSPDGKKMHVVERGGAGLRPIAYVVEIVN